MATFANSPQLEYTKLGARVTGEPLATSGSRWEQAGLSVTNEPFTFQSFALENAVLEAGTEKADIVKLGFNPYLATTPISGELAFVTATDTAPPL